MNMNSLLSVALQMTEGEITRTKAVGQNLLILKRLSRDLLWLRKEMSFIYRSRYMDSPYRLPMALPTGRLWILE
ncbi:hypothetical protein Psal027_00824 [Piscirickettsia salmonis]|nr:hypothetical protein [Piscirickettsia salmonis]APS58292.1 hypothetical protein AVI52_14260 [Piscirickettsia salmonis]QGN76615.1 hypothetical protein Psal001_00799 [Piscirickettsia salmonis]QGN80205.1 hypothetical protein Psal002_00824 [Piscirickettsia salmonis]QGN85523.1 hypothetical protein Psal003_02608 [Piscirickettsia salmonis]QGN89029.1 hypothetical protein Psal004_02600 [Piscirickettsia salmonis]